MSESIGGYKWIPTPLSAVHDFPSANIAADGTPNLVGSNVETATRLLIHGVTAVPVFAANAASFLTLYKNNGVDTPELLVTLHSRSLDPTDTNLVQPRYLRFGRGIEVDGPVSATITGPILAHLSYVDVSYYIHYTVLQRSSS